MTGEAPAAPDAERWADSGMYSNNDASNGPLWPRRIARGGLIMPRFRDACLAFTLALVLLTTAAPEAQQADKVHRLGYLAMSSEPDGRRLDSLRQALRDLGYLEGRNFVLEI